MARQSNIQTPQLHEKIVQLKTLAVVAIAIWVLSACGGDDSKHGKIVFSGDGKIYRLEYRTGDVYIVHELSVEDFESWQQLKEGKQWPANQK